MLKKTVRVLTFLLISSAALGVAWAGGAVYAMTNAIGNNQIVVYHRDHSGVLSLKETIGTGGGGSGLQLSAVDSLGSQGSLILDDLHHLLFAVNTETVASNSQDCQEGTISSFLIASDGSLTLADRVSSGGLFPNSLTFRYSASESSGVLYVLNAGGPGNGPSCGTPPNITGFRVNYNGRMTLRAGSLQPIIDPGPLNGTGSGVNCPPIGLSPAADFFCGLNPPAFVRSPAEIRFTPDGNQLVVTVKGTNSIYVYPVGEHGVPRVMQAPGPALPTYFGFTFDLQGHMIVTEAFGTSPTIPAAAAAVSSFAIPKTGALQEISADVADGGVAACWVALEPTGGKYAFVSNNLSNTISSYSVGGNGSLTLLAATAAPANGPNDLAAVADDGSTSFIYALESLTGTVKGWSVNLATGALTLLQTPLGGLPVNSGAQGLAAY